MKKIRTLGFSLKLAAVTFLLISCVTKTNNENASYYTNKSLLIKGPGEISVMTFNVENLFDNVHNEGVDDYTYLPIKDKRQSADAYAACKQVRSPYYRKDCFEKDWNNENLRFKLNQIAKVIRYVENGHGPDVILLAEVENANILKLLFDGELKDLGYKTIAILKGPDPRGINTAVVSKFELAEEPKLHIIPFKVSEELKRTADRTRGILEVTLKLPNSKKLSLLSAHFPSQSNPVELRIQAMEFMKNLMLEIEKSGRGVIAGGDLNTTQEEDEKHGSFSKILSEGGFVSHLVGCKQCDGSHYYRGSWSFLDVMAYGKKLKENARLELLPDTIHIVKAPGHSKFDGTPIRFNEESRIGVSDHFPLYSRLKMLD